MPRELILETSSTAEEVERALKTAVSDGTVLVIQDEKGGKTLVPADKIAYLEISDLPDPARGLRRQNLVARLSWPAAAPVRALGWAARAR